MHIHKKVEKLYYKQQRLEEIKKIQPTLANEKLHELVSLTRGKGQQDFIDAINNFVNHQPVVTDSNLRSNVCDCLNGVWSEHLLTKNEYETIITTAGFKMIYTAGYWDTHYSSGLKNFMSVIFNKIIGLLGNQKGIMLSPFVNVAAYN